jgi:predicted peptidase
MKYIFSILLAAIIGKANAQDFADYKFAAFRKGDRVLPYRILLPLSLDSLKKYPLIIFLHGAFQKGIDNESQLQIGGRYFLRPENRSAYPSIVLFPQCPQDDSWAFFETQLDSVSGLAKNWYFPFKKQPTPVTALLKQLLDSVTQEHYVDRDRIYIGGLSQGGMGVFDMVARYPEMFAAAFPICGAGKLNTVKTFAKEVAL